MKIIEPLVEVENFDGLKIMKNIERACRTCYRSEGLITEDSYKNLIKNCINRGHGCYDEETEVLTEKGWRHWKDVSMEDKFASLNEDWELEYIKPVALINTFYDGDMYYINSPKVNLKITPNHKVFCCPTTTRKGRKKEKNGYKLIEIQDIAKKSHAYAKTCKNIRTNSSCSLTEPELAFIGFAIGDGYYNVKNNYVEFHIKKERKIDFLKDICQQCNLSINVEKNNKYKIKTNLLKNFPIYTDKREKVIPQNLIESMSKEQCNALLKGLINSDGSIDSKRNTVSYCTTSCILASQIQQLCLHCGLFANIQNKGKPKFNSGGFAKEKAKSKYIISIGNEKFAKPEINYSKTKKQYISIENYCGNIYCAELPRNHTLYVRRNGIPVWSGNSVLEHEKVTVRLTCDIGVYKDLTRHRIASFSIESTRYCNYGKDKWDNQIKFIKPCNIEGDSELYSNWVGTMDFIEREYIAMSKNGATPDQMRMILPHSTAAEVTMTANIREWKHIFELRCSKRAHPSVQQVMIPLLLYFKEKMPEIYEGVEYNTEFPQEKYAKLTTMKGENEE